MAEVKSKGIAVTTNLSRRDMDQLAAELPKFGKAGLDLLGVIRAMSEAAQRVNDLTVELTISIGAGGGHEPVGSEPLATLGLGTRVHDILSSYGIRTIAQLQSKTADQLLEHRSFGRSSLRAVVRALQDRGLSLRN